MPRSERRRIRGNCLDGIAPLSPAQAPVAGGAPAGWSRRPRVGGSPGRSEPLNWRLLPWPPATVKIQGSAGYSENPIACHGGLGRFRPLGDRGPMARMRKYQPFADGAANRSDRPQAEVPDFRYWPFVPIQPSVDGYSQSAKPVAPPSGCPVQRCASI
jgi:hypothetical protein